MAGSVDLYVGASLDGGPDGRKPLRPASNYVWNGALWVPQAGDSSGGMNVSAAGAQAISGALSATSKPLDQMNELLFRILQKLDEISEILALSAPQGAGATTQATPAYTASNAN